MDDQDNHFVLPEGVNGHSPETFLENWLIDTFGHEKLTSIFVAEHAHRIPQGFFSARIKI